MNEFIEIRGARENNLKDVSLRVPKRQITIFTGVSGSGKSSIVFDTIATEAQRQLYENFSLFVRSFLPRYWLPTFDPGIRDGYRIGALTSGRDVIGRHAMEASLRAPTNGLGGLTGSISYQYSGLGLPIVATIVAAHGGTVTVDSEPGRGTCVRLHLPGPEAAS